ncbi:MAG: hypothetical protein EOP45_15660, partial [Sphingobacteriaceae bacterium]
MITKRTHVLNGFPTRALLPIKRWISFSWFEFANSISTSCSLKRCILCLDKHKGKVLDYEIVEPERVLTDFVERFWALRSGKDQDLDLVVIPDGRIDLIFTCSPDEPFQAVLI